MSDWCRDLADALTAILPGAIVVRTSAVDWHSAGLSGQRFEADLALPDCDAATSVEQFANALPNFEFELGARFVADIGVDGVKKYAESCVVIVKALVLDAY